MTLDDMIQQCAVDIDEILTISDGAYVGEDLVLAKKITAGINYAYQKIAREKHVLTTQEAITLGADGTFERSTLSLTAIKIFNVYDSDRESVTWYERNQSTVTCPDNDEGELMTVEYSYLPARLLVTELIASPLYPEYRVDHMILCYYSDFYVLSLEPDNETREKAATFLGLFNDGYDNVKQEIFENVIFRVK